MEQKLNYTLELTPDNLDVFNFMTKKDKWLTKKMYKEIRNLVEKRGVAYLSFNNIKKNIEVHETNVNKQEFNNNVIDKFMNTSNPMGFFMNYQFA